MIKNKPNKLRREISVTLLLKIVLLCILSYVCCQQTNKTIVTSKEWFLGQSI